MKYAGMPWAMWMLFGNSFEKQLHEVLNIDQKKAKEITDNAKREYCSIIERLPDFEKGDRFQMNIVSCAMLCAFLLHLNTEPSLSQVTEYYEKSMMTKPMHLFCRFSGKKKFTDQDYEAMKKTAAFKAAERNPYSWNMEFFPYENNRGYEARFTKCGICHLMKELGLFQYVPAMCQLDFTMSRAGGVSEFVREYTLASGGPYCDCGYLKK